MSRNEDSHYFIELLNWILEKRNSKKQKGQVKMYGFGKKILSYKPFSILQQNHSNIGPYSRLSVSIQGPNELFEFKILTQHKIVLNDC